MTKKYKFIYYLSASNSVVWNFCISQVQKYLCKLPCLKSQNIWCFIKFVYYFHQTQRSYYHTLMLSYRIFAGNISIVSFNTRKSSAPIFFNRLVCLTKLTNHERFVYLYIHYYFSMFDCQTYKLYTMYRNIII